MNADEHILEAREKLIEERERQGNPFSDVVIRGIRSGQWDRGDALRKYLQK